MPTVLHICKKSNWASRIWNTLLIFMVILSPTEMTVHSADWVKILVLGDSLTAGYGLKKQEAFPAKLEAAITAKGHAALVINAGVSGDTTAGGRTRLVWALLDKPHMVIVELGANDGLRGLKPSDTKANLKYIVQSLQEQNIAVILTGMIAPPNLGKEYGREFNNIYRDLAKTHNVVLYDFFLEGVANQPHLNQKDGIHPNPSGVNEIVRRILPTVTSAIKNMNSRGNGLE